MSLEIQIIILLDLSDEVIAVYREAIHFSLLFDPC